MLSVYCSSNRSIAGFIYCAPLKMFIVSAAPETSAVSLLLSLTGC